MADFDPRDLRLHDPEADQRMVSTPGVWPYLPQLLLYPLRGYALYIVVIMGALMWIAGYAGLFGIAASGILFGWIGYYAMGVVSHTATGHAVAPPLGTEVLFQGEKLRLGILVLYIVTLLMMAFAATRPGHPAWGVLVFVVGVYLFPALLASLALQPDLLAAMNPLTSISFAFKTGLPYLFACLVLSAIGFLEALLAGHVAGIVASMLTLYGLIFVCHLIGYVAYHRQDELGLAVTVERPTAESLAAVEQAGTLATLLKVVDAHLEAKDPRAARDALLAESGAGVANPRSFQEELFEALRLRHQDALSLVQGTRLIQLLVKEKRFTRALDIYEMCLDLSKDFVPEPPAPIPVLAEQAFKDKRLKLFTRIGDAVRAKIPDSDEAVSLQFLKAQALATGKQDAAALALLKPLLPRGGHPWAARIAALHGALSSLQKKA